MSRKTLAWTLEADGRWACEKNGKEVGVAYLVGEPRSHALWAFMPDTYVETAEIYLYRDFGEMHADLIRLLAGDQKVLSNYVTKLTDPTTLQEVVSAWAKALAWAGTDLEGENEDDSEKS